MAFMGALRFSQIPWRWTKNTPETMGFPPKNQGGKSMVSWGKYDGT